MSLYIYLACYIAAVIVVVVALFFPRARLRAVAAVLGALALWLPFTIYKTSLGRPNPFTVPGDYELLGVRWNPSATRIFILVNDDLRTPVPRLYSLDWAKPKRAQSEMFDMDESPHGYVGQPLHLDGSNTLTIVENFLQPPDLDKDKWYAEHTPAAPIREPLPGAR